MANKITSYVKELILTGIIVKIYAFMLDKLELIIMAKQLQKGITYNHFMSIFPSYLIFKSTLVLFSIMWVFYMRANDKILDKLNFRWTAILTIILTLSILITKNWSFYILFILTIMEFTLAKTLILVKNYIKFKQK